MPADPSPAVVAIVDDDASLREGLDLLLGTRGYAVETFASAEEFLARPGGADPACLVADVRLGPGMDGVALVAALRARGGRLPVIMLTGHADVDLAVRAMRAGAFDFLEKPFETERLLAAVAEGIAQAPAAARPDAAEAARARVAALTPREQQVLASLVGGNANKNVAHALGISMRTVAAHRAAVMEKLGVRSFAQAVRLAVSAGLVAEEP
ncbi:response regulator transcription factor [Falsiroseomonas sp. CW058]|uniref:response regulator transcription factor n=1 Tax=Falsiroseomonas sp. CW058 TaxID=3388664 RepID=UPI003D315500